MNFIDKAFSQNLTGDDFLQAMASIYSEPEVYEILNQYPVFVSDVISIIDYDTGIQMDGLDDVINGNLCGRCTEIIEALERCGVEDEADILKRAKELYESDEDSYDKEYDNLYRQLADIFTKSNNIWQQAPVRYIVKLERFLILSKDRIDDVFDTGTNLNGLVIAKSIDFLLENWSKVLFVDIYDWYQGCDEEVH